jgi:prepilin-type processing-associated H-X9-DG protein
MKRNIDKTVRIRRGRSRGGFSRLELAIVVAIAVLILALLAPGVESAREIARRYQCQAHLRQLGVALHSYHDTYAILPPASFWDDAEMIIDKNMRPARAPDEIVSTRANWAQLLLPFAGQSDVGRRFAPGLPITDEANAAARLSTLSMMVCPSDPYSTPENAYVLTDSHGAQFGFARGNYAINGGTQTNAEWPGRLSFPITDGNMIRFRSQSATFQWWGNGVAGFNHCFSLDEFRNGLSNTVAVDEVRSGIVPEDPRGAWALGQIGSSVTWAHGVNGDAYGPNNQLKDSDDILEGRQVAKKYGMERFYEAGVPFCAHCSFSNQATSRSLHVGGVNVLMADGSQRFIADLISPGLSHVLHSRETPRDVLDMLSRADLSDRSSEPSVHSGAVGNRADAVDGRDSQISNAARPVKADPWHNSVGMAFVSISPGRFLMGQPDANNQWGYPKHDAPPHEVRIVRGFHAGVCEVTQRQFEMVMGGNPSWHSAAGGGASVVEELDTSNFPVENVTWDAATEFCERLSGRPDEKQAGRIYRLPTEAEWEYTCRAGASEPPRFIGDWPDENDFAEIAGKNKHPTLEPLVPKPVGSFTANAFGVYDMRGNVFEWCSDWFERGYYARSPIDDPQGPAHGHLKVIRGWDWAFIGPQCKDFLFVTPPWQANQYVGFRVVCEIAGHSAEFRMRNGE